MSAIDYLVNAILVLLVLRQIRETRLTPQALAMPVVLVAAAAVYYLRSVPVAGNDLVLELALAATGGLLGALCALATRMRRAADGVPVVRARWLAGILWVAGIGARMGFAYATSHGAGPAEVTTRLAVMWVRAHQLPAVRPAAPARVPAVI